MPNDIDVDGGDVDGGVVECDLEVGRSGANEDLSEGLSVKEVNRRLLRALVRGAYDIQKLRIATGNRFIANFKCKLGQAPGEKEDQLDPEARELFEDIRRQNRKAGHVLSGADGGGVVIVEDDDDDDGGEEDPETGRHKRVGMLKAETTQKLWKKVRERFAVVAPDGVLPKKKKFEGDPIISDYTELSLISLYLTLVRDEEKHVTLIKHAVHPHPLWQQYMKTNVRGCAEGMTAVLLSEVKIERDDNPAKLWGYCGLGVVKMPDGTTEGMGRKPEHLVQREYIDKEGNKEIKDSIAFNPFLKTKMVGVLGTCFLRTKDSSHRYLYDDAKARYTADAVYGEHRDKESAKIKREWSRQCVDAKKAKKPKPQRPTWTNPKTGKIEPYIFTSPGRRHAMARRIMIKRFLRDVWVAWRRLEGLSTTQPHAEQRD